MRWLRRLMEIKEMQLNAEFVRNQYLLEILEILKGGTKNGKRNKNKN